MFCSLYNNMKRSRNIPRFQSKQTSMSMTQCEGVRVARRLLALFGEQSFIFDQDLNTSFHNIQKTPLTRSGFETMFLHCIKSTRFDARLHESPSNASMWKYTFGCWRQWPKPNLTRPAVFRGRTRAHPRTAAGYRAYQLCSPREKIALHSLPVLTSRAAEKLARTV